MCDAAFLHRVKLLILVMSVCVQVESTGWLLHIREVLRGVLAMVTQIDRNKGSLLSHCTSLSFIFDCREFSGQLLL